MPTPHIEAKSDEIARVVLMPGDPARAQWIAEKYLENPRLVSNVRRICCYTGTYQGQTVSVMASGMGMPSIGIYSYELFSRYGTEAIIRIGSAGAYTGDLKLRDVFLAQAAWTQSSFAREQNLDSSSWFYPSEHLNQVIMRASAADGIRPVCGALHSSDVFYHEAAADAELKKLVQENHLLCVEMESAALFHNAAVLGREAACLVTTSDDAEGGKMTPQERETSFDDMARLALDAAAMYLQEEEQKTGK